MGYAKEYMDFEKKYKEALNWMRELYPGLHGATKEDAEHYFPELRESEDERIRKIIRLALIASEEELSDFYKVHNTCRKECTDWLEKQKDITPIVVSNEDWDCQKAYSEGYQKGMIDSNKRVEGSEDERIRKEIVHYILYKADGVSEKQEHEWIAYLEKQKEREIIIPERKLTDFEIEVHEIIAQARCDKRLADEDVLKQFEQEAACALMLKAEKQKEQKPDQTVDEKEYIRTIKGIIADFIRDKQPKDVAFYQKIYDWIDGRHVEQKPNIELIQRSWYMEGYHDREFNKEPKWIIKTGEGGPKHELNPKYGEYIKKEQKPAEKQDYSGLSDFERAIHRGFLCAGMENVPATIIKETAQDCLAQIKPAEWDKDWREEDIQTRFAFYTYKDNPSELYLSNVFVEEASRNHGFGTRILKAAEKVAETIGATTICLKVKMDSPANAWYRKHGYGYVTFEDGYDWLEKNLEYLKPTKSVEWSEEDEKKLRTVISLMKASRAVDPFYDKMCLEGWLESLPERFNPQLKQEWSEEDEENFKWFDKFFRAESVIAGGRDIPQSKYLWFKSLRPQPKQDDRYMEGYLKGWKDAEDAYNKSVTFHYDFNHHLSCYEGGPCTNPQMDCVNCPRKGTAGMPIFTSPNTAIGRSTAIPHWKPSEEQITVFHNTMQRLLRAGGTGKWYAILESLYNDLKKL